MLQSILIDNTIPLSNVFYTQMKIYEIVCIVIN